MVCAQVDGDGGGNEGVGPVDQHPEHQQRPNVAQVAGVGATGRPVQGAGAPNQLVQEKLEKGREGRGEKIYGKLHCVLYKNLPMGPRGRALPRR